MNYIHNNAMQGTITNNIINDSFIQILYSKPFSNLALVH